MTYDELDELDYFHLTECKVPPSTSTLVEMFAGIITDVVPGLMTLPAGVQFGIALSRSASQPVRR